MSFIGLLTKQKLKKIEPLFVESIFYFYWLSHLQEGNEIKSFPRLNKIKEEAVLISEKVKE